MALRIATWNINGIKARLELLVRWLDEEKPDIVGLQEIKSIDEAFPRAEIEALKEKEIDAAKPADLIYDIVYERYVVGSSYIGGTIQTAKEITLKQY